MIDRWVKWSTCLASMTMLAAVGYRWYLVLVAVLAALWCSEEDWTP